MGAGRESSYMPNKTRKRAFRIGRSRTGLGLFATAPIKKEAFIVEYKGRKLTTEQADKLEARGNRYLYEINSRWAIDGTSRKNLGRYANHSCRPNAETHRIGHKVIIRAIKNIKASAEITYNYGRDYLTNVAGLDFIFHKDGMIVLTEAGFRRMGQAHSAGLDTVIEVDQRYLLHYPASKPKFAGAEPVKEARGPK